MLLDEESKRTLCITVRVTLRCNYSCPYCINDKHTKKYDLFLLHDQEEWIDAFRRYFNSYNLNFNFTGGEPFIYKKFIVFAEKLSREPNVRNITINTNASLASKFTYALDPVKVKLMPDYHPTGVELEHFFNEAKKLHASGHLDMINYIAYPYEASKVNYLLKKFGDEGMFLNVSWNYKAEHEYTDLDRGRLLNIITPDDRQYKHGRIVYGKPCMAGVNYIEFINNGDAFRCCGNERRGNLFDGTLRLNRRPKPCPIIFDRCLHRYPLLTENNLPHAPTLTSFVNRNQAYRAQKKEGNSAADQPDFDCSLPRVPYQVHIRQRTRFFMFRVMAKLKRSF